MPSSKLIFSSSPSALIRYQIVSTYFLNGAFKELSSVDFLVESLYPRATPKHPEDLLTLYVMRVQKRKWRTFGVFSEKKKATEVGNSESSGLFGFAETSSFALQFLIDINQSACRQILEIIDESFCSSRYERERVCFLV